MEIVQSKSWTVPDAVLNRIACDLIITAIEGGINHWAQVLIYKWTDPDLGRGDKVSAMARIVDTRDDGATYDVTVPKIVAAIVKVMNGEVKPFYSDGYTKTYAQRLAGLFDELSKGVELDETEYDHDADDADCMVQLAVLGDVRYG